MNILVTGAFGWTAQAIIEALSEHEITAFDLLTAEWPDSFNEMMNVNVVMGSVADFDAVTEAMTGVDAVVHLAVAVGEGDYDKPHVPFNTNVLGTYNIFEAARKQGVKRIVLMSEAAVHVDYPDDMIVKATDTLKTNSDNDNEHLYDFTKHLQEEIACHYADVYGMSVVVLRPGHIVDGREDVDPHKRPLSQVQYLRGAWVCRYDLATAVLKGIEGNFSSYNAFHIIGGYQSREKFDIVTAEQALGMTINEQFGSY